MNETRTVPDFLMYRGETVNNTQMDKFSLVMEAMEKKNLRSVLGAVILDREFKKASWRKCVPMETPC